MNLTDTSRVCRPTSTSTANVGGYGSLHATTNTGAAKSSVVSPAPVPPQSSESLVLAPESALDDGVIIEVAA